MFADAYSQAAWHLVLRGLAHPLIKLGAHAPPAPELEKRLGQACGVSTCHLSQTEATEPNVHILANPQNSVL